MSPPSRHDPEHFPDDAHAHGVRPPLFHLNDREAAVAPQLALWWL
jgi:hypothetical protein